MSNPKPCATYIVVVVLYIYFINKSTITTMTTNVYSRETAVHNGKATTKTARPQALQERPSTWLHTWPTKVWRSIEPGRTHPDCPRLVAWTETELLDGGNELIAAELLWRALAHCLITIAMNEGVPHDSHGALRHIARHIATNRNSDFGAAEQLHLHFYHGHTRSQSQ